MLRNQHKQDPTYLLSRVQAGAGAMMDFMDINLPRSAFMNMGMTTKYFRVLRSLLNPPEGLWIYSTHGMTVCKTAGILRLTSQECITNFRLGYIPRIEILINCTVSINEYNFLHTHAENRSVYQQPDRKWTVWSPSVDVYQSTGTLFISVISDNRHRVLLLLLIFICTSGPKDLYQTSL